MPGRRSRENGLVDVDTAADDLYAVLPDDFMARRDELVGQARASGDRSLAADIKALRKPTTVAWLANQLARHHSDEVGPLLALGEALREATEALSGPELRELSRQRTAVVRALVRRARALAVSLGRPVTESVGRELEQTLLAALADPAQAELLAAGRLTERLEHSGFAGPAVPSRPPSAAQRKAAAAREQAAPAPTDEERRRAARRTELEQQLEGAWQAASAAKDAYDEAGAALQQSRRRRSEAEQLVTGRRRDLEEAETELASAGSAAQAAADHEQRADGAVKAARAAISALQRELDEVSRRRRSR